MPGLDAERPSRHLRAIVDTIAPGDGNGLSEADRRRVVDESAVFVAGQVAAMSKELRFKAWAGIAGFRAYALLRRGKPFDTLPLDARQRLAERWSYGSLYLPRQLFRMLRSLTLLAWFEHPLVVRTLVGSPSHDAAGNPSGSAAQRISPPDRTRR